MRPKRIPTLHTIGHSRRSLEELIQPLRRHETALLADVRTAPRSRRVPQFNRESLVEALPAAGIEYRHIPELGGFRKPRPDSLNSAWRNASFRGYADHMQTPEFQAALEELLAVAADLRTAIMCAEALPYRCHRSLIADAVTARRLTVEHIIDSWRTERHRLTRFAVVEGERISYPSE